MTPREAGRHAVRATRSWSRSPAGRLTLPAVLLLALITASGAAGIVLIPATAGESRPDRVTASASGPALPGNPDLGLPPTAPPGTAPPGVPAPTGVPGLPAGRPADVLAAWAQQTGARAGIPPVAVQAYGYAELVLAQTTPNCKLTWTTLAAIGLVESDHGRANGATLGLDGQSVPKIIGLPLDGTGGRQKITDTDAGQLDDDRVYDRAVGPMQFIPTTWRQSGIDADNDGVANPQDIDDAALAAANYLCQGGRNLSVAADWWNAILSYNDVRRYAQSVFDAANRYGAATRS